MTMHQDENRFVQAAAPRRDFLKLCAGAALGLAAPAVLGARHGDDSRALAFYNTHTGEKLSATYWEGGAYNHEALNEIDWILRDFRTGEVKAMERPLLDLLHALQRKVDKNGAFHIISGYRSPKTNATLRQHSNGVARRSLHMRGKAIDIRLPGCDLRQLQRAARALKTGGVGYYGRSNFIHVDTGRVRYW